MKLFSTIRIVPFLSIAAFVLLANLPSVQAQTAFWGTVPTGGASGAGVIYSINPDGSNMQVRYSFLTDGIDGNGPSAGLTQAGGLLYGLTTGGGTSGNGTLYSIDPVSGNYQKLVDLAGYNGTSPTGSLILYNGLLYGFTAAGGANGMGVIFSYDPSGGDYTDVYDLSQATGGGPAANLMLLSNQFFFTTTGGAQNGSGAIDVYSPASNTCKDLYDFGAGIYAPCNLVFYKNLLYGFNSNGGISSGGQLFSFDPVVRKYAVVYQFPGQTSAPAGSGPASLILYKNKLYGTADYGGNSPSGNGSSGVLFSFDPSGNTYSDIFDFDNSYAVTNGGLPAGYPIAINGKLYGTTSYGGPTSAGSPTGDGILYQFDLDSDQFTPLLPFDGMNGMNPYYAALLPVGPVTPGTIPQTITYFADSAKMYGAPNFYLGAVSSSGLPITYSTSDYTVAALIANGIQVTGAGTCKITASQAGDDTYAAAAPVTINLTVAQAPLLITADDKIAYENQPVPPLSITYKGFVNSEDSSYLITLPTASSIVDASTPQGTYPITVSGASSNNYTITYRNGTFYVYGLQQIFTANDSIATYGDADFSVATASSGLPVTYSAVDPAVVSPSTTPGLLHINGAGTTRVAVIQKGNSSFAPGSDSVTITIQKAPLTITANNQSMMYGAPEPLFTVMYSGFVYGQDSSVLTALPLVVPSAPTHPIYPGTYLIEVSGAKSPDYNFTYVNGVFTVSLAGDSLYAWSNAPGSVTAHILSLSSRQALLKLYNMMGQCALTSPLSLQKGYNSFTLPAAGFASGIYILLVEAAGLRLKQKIRIN